MCYYEISQSPGGRIEVYNHMMLYIFGLKGSVLGQELLVITNNYKKLTSLPYKKNTDLTVKN